MIVRVQKHENPYVIIDKAILEDDRLTFKARGLAAYLLGKPDDWSISERHLVECGPDGAAAIRSGLKELEEAGYLKRNRRRTDDGKFTWEATLFEVPQPCRGFPRVDKPRTDNPHVEKPHVDNRAILKNEVLRNELPRNEDQEGESNSTPQPATEPAPANPEPAPQSKRRGRVTKDFIDPRKLIAGMIPEGKGETPVEIHREFFDWGTPSEGLSTFNCKVITDEVKDLEKWRATCRAWAEKGFRGGNRQGLQDWYRGANQGAGKEGARAKSRSEKPMEGWHAGLVKEWQPDPEDEEDFQRWIDSLNDQPEQPAVRPLRQRPAQSAEDRLANNPYRHDGQGSAYGSVR